MLERLANHPFYCFLDGYSGFFQIPIHPNDQEKTTFTCPYGTFAYRRMPFGLCNAPATFQRCMTSIFSDLIEEMGDIKVVDKKGVENVVTDHLSRMRVEDIVPINDSMPEEQLMAIMILKESFDEKVRLEEVKALRDENLPWYADIVNFMVYGEVPSNFDAYKRKKFFKDARHYYWDEPYLYKRGPDSIYRRCIAEEDVQGVLEHCHGSAYGGTLPHSKPQLRFCNLVYGGLLVQGCSKLHRQV
ncbi:unnamed protein product [Microthlaspi erraticum]|uniref:Reverse transcriptase domain-containing protein n=1 Tax=Microthlaspi erraticum TaxID=1685480 RepID=A0A6D2KX88_9BRAS|nr:unnamed protein product [Microthlaspi erraticum]